MLTDEDLIIMAPRISAMMQTPGWKDYVDVISDKIQTTIEVGFGGDPADLPRRQGEVAGLTAAVISGDDVLTTVRTLTGEKREARQRAIRAGAPLSSFD